MKNRNTLRCVLAGSILLTAACGGTSETALQFDAAALEAPAGNVSTSDEAPAFGDPVVATDEVPDAAEGGVTSDEDATAEAARARVYYLAAAWGQLRWSRLPGTPSDAALPETRPMPTVWNGTLCATAPGVALRLLRAVRFEGRTDHIVRRGPECIEWRSATLPRWDGLLVRVVAGPNVPADATALTFTTGAASATITRGELEGLHRVLDTGNERGDKVAMVAMPRPGCGGGFLEGRWIRLSARGGVFAARVAGHDGAPAGHVRGVWGTRQSGERVLFGKLITSEGRFVGRLVGTYGDGRLRAVYETREGLRAGAVYGRYTGDDGRGWLRAVHVRACEPRADACSCDAAPPSASTPDAAPACRCEAPNR